MPASQTIERMHTGACAGAGAAVVEESEEEEEDIREVDGVFLNRHNLAVEPDTGVVVTPSKLTVLQMRAELAARGLMTEGNRRDLYKRIQVCALLVVRHKRWRLGTSVVTSHACCPLSL